jgi:hypothetical protein
MDVALINGRNTPVPSPSNRSNAGAARKRRRIPAMPLALLMAGAAIATSGVGDGVLTRLSLNHNETVLTRS